MCAGRLGRVFFFGGKFYFLGSFVTVMAFFESVEYENYGTNHVFFKSINVLIFLMVLGKFDVFDIIRR